MTVEPHWASGVCAGLHAAGSRHVVYVPDNPLAHVLRILDEGFPDVRTTLATREEEAFGIAAGLYLGGARPTVMLQSSGLGNSLNALTSLLLPYKIPALIVISMRGDAGEWNDAQVPLIFYRSVGVFRGPCLGPARAGRYERAIDSLAPQPCPGTCPRQRTAAALFFEGKGRTATSREPLLNS